MSEPTLTTPVEIDTAIAAKLALLQRAEQKVTTQEGYLASESAYTRLHFDEDKYAEALEQFDTLSAENEALQALYTNWPRYWHVTNVNGHIHTSQSCSSCFPDTRFSWRTDLSGLTPEQVVEREAYNACSVCMPIAPAEQKAARTRYNAEQRAARKAEKDQKASEKLRKAAERAQKLVAKVDAWYESQGGREAVNAWDSSRLYAEHCKLPTQVGDVVYDEYHAHHEDTTFRHGKDPRKVVAEAKEKGLI